MDQPALDWGWTPPDPPDSAAGTLNLWSPAGVGLASFLLGFPGATVLAAMNWRQMGQPRKAVAHLVGAVAGTWALYFVPERIIPLVAIVVSVYLIAVQRSDQGSLQAAGRVKGRSALAGAVIALVGTLAIVGSGILVGVILETPADDHLGDVVFHPGHTDDCSWPGRDNLDRVD